MLLNSTIDLDFLPNLDSDLVMGVCQTNQLGCRQTRTVSVFPVGLVGKFGLSSPVILRGTVHTFYDSYDSGRTFKVDMAGFAVNLEYFRCQKYGWNYSLVTKYVEMCPWQKTLRISRCRISEVTRRMSS